MKRSVTNVRSLFSESNRNSYLYLVLFEPQQIITLHHVGCQNKCHLVTACPIPKSLRFRSVLNFRVATKILIYHNSIAKFISFLFSRVFFINQMLYQHLKVFRSRGQETGKWKHKEPSIKSAKQKNFIAYTDLIQFVTIRTRPCYRKSPLSAPFGRRGRYKV